MILIKYFLSLELSSHITISSILKNLGDQNTDKISEFESNLTLELRAISKQLSDIEKSTNKLNNK